MKFLEAIDYFTFFASPIRPFGCLPLLLAVLALIVATWIAYRSYMFGFFRRHGVPGPAPSVLDGNFRELTKSEKGSWLIIDDWIRKYGNVFGYYRGGPTPLLVVADHEMLKTILIKDFAHFTDRTVIGSSRKRVPKIFSGALTMLTGQDWKRVRNTLTPTFTAKKMKMMSSTMNRIVDVLLSILQEKADSKEITDIYSLFQQLTLDVIGSCAFAMNVDCQRNPEDIFLKHVRTIFKKANSPALRIIQMFPELNFLIGPIIGLVATTFKTGQLLADNLETVIAYRRRNKVENIDLIQLMLEASEDAVKDAEPADSSAKLPANLDVRKKYITEDEMVANSFIFLLAGYETTANCLGFTAYLLAKYPECQDKLFEEISEKIGLTTIPDYDTAHNLPYLEMVIAESLRMFPPVTNFVTRIASETVIVNDHRILAGTGVEVPVWHLQHDPDVWDKPYHFDPERFAPEVRASIPPMAYLPFGAGPRNCIGMRFAQLEIKIALVRLLQKFRLVQCEKSEPEIQLSSAISTINPKNGVFVRVVAR